MGKFWECAAAVALVGASVAGQAQAAGQGCWSTQEIAAAKIRDLQTMLMVAGLRCRTSGIDVLAGYNRFVNSNRPAITLINGHLKSHFNSAHGPAIGQRAYDSFTTSLANAYGAGGSGSEDCADMAELAEQAAVAGGTREALLTIAEQRGLEPRLPETRCPVSIASK